MRSLNSCSLTIGIIAKNGLPFLNECLASLPTHLEPIQSIHVILVDCVSNDSTLEVMKEFSTTHRHVRVFSIEGKANAAVARNVILEHTTTEYLMLLDGDTILSSNFLLAGIERIQNGEAEAVIGNMEEQRFDANNEPDGSVFWRCRVTKPVYVRTTNRCTGSILLGPKVLESQIRYDNLFRRGQDRDFALCVSATFRILHISEQMGRHLTHYYFSKSRLKEFYQAAYPRPIGLLLRKHGLYPDRLWQIMKEEKGVFVGFFYQVLFIVGVIFLNKTILGILLCLIVFDGFRFLLKGEIPRFLALRFFSPILVIQGIFGMGEPHPIFTVKPIVSS